jgi:hypothetical protein
MKKVLFLSLAAIFFAASATFASNFSFSSPLTKVETGKTLKMLVKINPAGEKIYTAKAEISYDREKLDFVSFAYAKDWLPVSVSGYDLVDENKGSVIKTAGMPGGISEQTIFGVLSFLVKKEGRTTVTIGTQSFALNSENSNTLTDKSSISINIVKPAAKPASKKTSTAASSSEIALGEEENNPENLFDIMMETYPNSLKESKNLSTQISFTNFGMVATPVEMTFTIVNERGEVVAQEQDALVVETENVFIKNFSNLNLSRGKYTLVLKTVYGKNVTDEFKNNFTILLPEKQWWLNSWVIAPAAFALFFIFFLFGSLIGRKKKAGLKV